MKHQLVECRHQIDDNKPRTASAKASWRLGGEAAFSGALLRGEGGGDRVKVLDLEDAVREGVPFFQERGLKAGPKPKRRPKRSPEPG